MDRAQYLRQLHARFGLGQADVIRVVQRATGGTVAIAHRLIRGDEREVHRVKLTDRSVVYLRVTFPGTSPSKTFHEAWAMDLARDRGVPTPTVLAVETICTSDGERTAAVITESPGDQLQDVLPSLRPEDRVTVMNRIGQLLKMLHAISMPGAGVPDDQGSWTDPATHHRSYQAARIDDCEHLAAAGLAPREIDQVIDVLQSSTDEPRDTVLCHGDISPQHVFIDRELRIVGLIDWGMWHAGSAVSELAGLELTNTPKDFSAIIAGHEDGEANPMPPLLMRWHAVAQATHQVAWLVTSGQTTELHRATTTLRKACRSRSGTS